MSSNQKGAFYAYPCPVAFRRPYDLCRGGWRHIALRAGRVRLLGIDAPEMGKCPKGRKCVKGSGKACAAGTIRYLIRRRAHPQSCFFKQAVFKGQIGHAFLQPA